MRTMTVRSNILRKLLRAALSSIKRVALSSIKRVALSSIERATLSSTGYCLVPVRLPWRPNKIEIRIVRKLRINDKQ